MKEGIAMLANENISAAMAIKIPVSPYCSLVKPPSFVKRYVLRKPRANPPYTITDEIILCLLIWLMLLFAANLLYIFCIDVKIRVC